MMDPIPPRSSLFTLGLLLAALAAVLILALLCLTGAVAAPARTPADEIVGEFKLGAKEGPLVTLPDPGDGLDREYWLVFTDATAEARARDVHAGDRVRVKGRLGVGGDWRYLVATEIRKED